MKRYIPLIISFILLIALAGSYAFMVSAVNANVARMGAALAEADALSARAASLQSASALLSEVAPLRDELASAIIRSGEDVRAIEIVEAVGADERVDVSIASVAPRSAGWQRHEQVALSTSVEGTYPRIARFLAALEAYGTAVRLESITLEKSGDTSWFGTVAVTFIKESL